MIMSLLFACWMQEDVYQDKYAQLADVDMDGFTVLDGDCDDDNPIIHPDADEICDEVDNDCDGETDNHPVSGSRWYLDEDGDGCPDVVEIFCADPGEPYMDMDDNPCVD